MTPLEDAVINLRLASRIGLSAHFSAEQVLALVDHFDSLEVSGEMVELDELEAPKFSPLTVSADFNDLVERFGYLQAWNVLEKLKKFLEEE